MSAAAVLDTLTMLNHAKNTLLAALEDACGSCDSLCEESAYPDESAEAILQAVPAELLQNDFPQIHDQRRESPDKIHIFAFSQLDIQSERVLKILLFIAGFYRPEDVFITCDIPTISVPVQRRRFPDGFDQLQRLGEISFFQLRATFSAARNSS